MAGTSSQVVIGGRRVSKKRNKNSRNNQLIQRSSASEVESMDDMLLQIFLRLPVISLILFKSVCKRWFNLITSSHFIQLRTQIPKIDPTSGLFLQRRTISVTYEFAALDTRIPTNKIVSKACFPFSSDRNRNDIYILQSCNGLLLCLMLPDETLYVYNPTTNQFKMLLLGDFFKPVALWNYIHMVFDPTKSPHYKVMCVEAIEDGIQTAFIQIKTYSSETCNWSVYGDRLPIPSFDGFTNGVYWNDSIYWINMKVDLLFKLDPVNLHLTVVPTPGKLSPWKLLHFKHNLFVSRDSLLFVSACLDAGFLMVYEMKSGYSEWLLKYRINVHHIIFMVREDKDLDISVKEINFRCIVLEEKEEDSFMVLELFGKVVRYKMVSETLHELSDAEVIPNCISMEPPMFCCFPFIASFAGV